jgi:hypothetical protein
MEEAPLRRKVIIPGEFRGATAKTLFKSLSEPGVA